MTRHVHSIPRSDQIIYSFRPPNRHSIFENFCYRLKTEWIDLLLQNDTKRTIEMPNEDFILNFSQRLHNLEEPSKAKAETVLHLLEKYKKHYNSQ